MFTVLAARVGPDWLEAVADRIGYPVEVGLGRSRADQGRDPSGRPPPTLPNNQQLKNPPSVPRAGPLIRPGERDRQEGLWLKGSRRVHRRPVCWFGWTAKGRRGLCRRQAAAFVRRLISPRQCGLPPRVRCFARRPAVLDGPGKRRPGGTAATPRRAGLVWGTWAAPLTTFLRKTPGHKVTTPGRIKSSL